MNKLFKITLGLLFVALLAFGGIFLFTNSIVSKFRPQIERLASDTLGTPISFERLSVSLIPSTKLKLSGFKVPRHNSEDQAKLSLKDLYLLVDLKDLLNRKLNITELLLDSLELGIVKDDEGYHIPLVESLGKKKVAPPSVTHSDAPHTSEGSQDGSPLSVALSSFRLRNGNISVIEKDGSILLDIRSLGVLASLLVENEKVKLPRFSIDGLLPPDAKFECTGSAELSPTELILSNVDIEGFSGTVSTKLKFSPQSKMYATSGELSNIVIDKVISVIPSKNAPPISGILHAAKWELNGTTDSSLSDSSHGSLSFTVKDGLVKGVNLAAAVLKSVKDLPFLSTSLYSVIPDAERAALESPDTAVQLITGDVAIASGTVRTENLRVVSPLFEMNASGVVSLDMTVDLKTDFIFSPALSASLAAKVKELSAIKDEKGRIVLPIEIRGKVPQISVVPNLETLIKGAGRKILEEKAGEFLNRALGGKEKKQKLGLFGF